MDLMDPPSPLENETTPEDPLEAAARWRGRLGAGLEIVSVAFLLASFRWAHHWNPLTVTTVAAWAITWLAGFWFSARALRRGGRPATLGFVIALLMLFVVAGTGIAAAAGANPVGSCGGG